ncbi:MAG: PHP domain-containing protein [Candidatus Korarchaeota archaeon]
MIRCDMHVHTWYSADGSFSPREMALIAVKRGMNGFVITDHDTTKGHKAAKEAARELKIIFVPGEEVTSAEKKHILAIGIEECVKSGLPMAEAIDKIHDLGGVAVAPHPYDLVYGIKSSVRDYKYDGIEWRCSQNWISNILTSLLLRDLRVSRVGGTDSHHMGSVGNSWTEFPNAESLDDIIEGIRKGKCRPGGAWSFPSTVLIGLGYAANAVIKKGFREWKRHFL